MAKKKGDLSLELAVGADASEAKKELKGLGKEIKEIPTSATTDVGINLRVGSTRPLETLASRVTQILRNISLNAAQQGEKFILDTEKTFGKKKIRQGAITEKEALTAAGVGRTRIEYERKRIAVQGEAKLPGGGTRPTTYIKSVEIPKEVKTREPKVITISGTRVLPSGERIPYSYQEDVLKPGERARLTAKERREAEARIHRTTLGQRLAAGDVTPLEFLRSKEAQTPKYSRPVNDFRYALATMLYRGKSPQAMIADTSVTHAKKEEIFGAIESILPKKALGHMRFQRTIGTHAGTIADILLKVPEEYRRNKMSSLKGVLKEDDYYKMVGALNKLVGLRHKYPKSFEDYSFEAGDLDNLSVERALAKAAKERVARRGQVERLTAGHALKTQVMSGQFPGMSLAKVKRSKNLQDLTDTQWQDIAYEIGAVTDPTLSRKRRTSTDIYALADAAAKKAQGTLRTRKTIGPTGELVIKPTSALEKVIYPETRPGQYIRPGTGIIEPIYGVTPKTKARGRIVRDRFGTEFIPDSPMPTEADLVSAALEARKRLVYGQYVTLARNKQEAAYRKKYGTKKPIDEARLEKQFPFEKFFTEPPEKALELGPIGPKGVRPRKPKQEPIGYSVKYVGLRGDTWQVVTDSEGNVISSQPLPAETPSKERRKKTKVARTTRRDIGLGQIPPLPVGAADKGAVEGKIEHINKANLLTELSQDEAFLASLSPKQRARLLKLRESIDSLAIMEAMEKGNRIKDPRVRKDFKLPLSSVGRKGFSLPQLLPILGGLGAMPLLAGAIGLLPALGVAAGGIGLAGLAGAVPAMFSGLGNELGFAGKKSNEHRDNVKAVLAAQKIGRARAKHVEAAEGVVQATEKHTKELFNTKQALEAAGVSESAYRRALKSGRFPQGIGRQGTRGRMFSQEDIAALTAWNAGGRGTVPPIDSRVVTTGGGGGGGGGRKGKNKKEEELQINTVNAQFGRSVGQAFQVLGSYAVAGGFIYGAVDALKEGFTAATKFEEELLRLQGILGSKGISGLLTISDDAVSNAVKYGQALNEVLELTSFLIQTGGPVANVSTDVENILKSITGLGIPINSAKELIISMRSITEGRIDVDIFDRIAAVQAKAAISAYDLSEALKTTGTIARELRGDFVALVDEVDITGSAIATVVTKTGVPGSQAATSLRNTLARLGRPEVVGALQDIGQIKLATVESGGTELRPMLEIFQELARVYKEMKTQGRGAELQRLLVQLSGSRQTAAIAGVLQDFDKVMQTAETSSLAFGDSQTRTNIVLEATALKIRAISESVKALGVSVLDSKIGEGIKGAIGGVSTLFQWVSKGSNFAELKIIGLITGIVALTKAVKILGTYWSILMGAKRAEQFNEVTLYASKAVKSLYTSARETALKGTGFVGFLQKVSGYLTSTGTLLLGLGALAAAIYGVGRAFGWIGGKKQDPLKPFTLSIEQLKDIPSPKIEAFRESVRKINEDLTTPVTDRGFFFAISNAARTVLPKYLDQLRAINAENPFSAIDKLAGKRPQMVNEFITALEGQIPGFRKWVNAQLQGLSELEASAKRTEIVMKLVGESAFIEGGVLQYGLRQTKANYIEFANTLRNLGAIFRGLEQTKEGIPVVGRVNKTDTTRIITGAALAPGSPAVVSSGFIRSKNLTLAGLLETFKGKAFDASGTLSEFLATIIKAIDGANEQVKNGKEKLSTQFESAIEEYSRSTGDLIIDARDAYKLFAQTVEKNLNDPNVRNAASVRFTSSLMLRSQALGDLSGVAFADQTVSNLGDTALNQLIDDSLARLIAGGEALANTPGSPNQMLARLFSSTGAGITALIAGQGGALAGQKDPLTDFLQKMYFLVNELDFAAEAVKKFGFSIKDLTERRVSSWRGLLEEWSKLPLGIFQQLTEAQQALDAFIRANTGKLKPGDMTEQLNLEASRSTEYKNLLGRRNALQTQLFTMSPGFGQRTREILQQVRALRVSSGLNTDDVDKLLDQLSEEKIKKLLDASRLQEFLLKVEKTVKDNYEESIRELIRFNDQVFRQQFKNALSIGRAEMLGALRKERMEGRTQRYGVGRTTIESLGERVSSISEASQIDKELARFRYDSEIALLNASGLSKEQLEIETQRVTNEYILGELARDQNTQKEKLLTIERAINEELVKQEQQIYTNLEERLSGLREVLSNYNTFAKGGALRAILQPIGQSFIKRQIDMLFTVFQKEGILGKFGKLLGGLGEQVDDPILEAHIRGAREIQQAIIEGHKQGLAEALLAYGIVPRGNATTPGDEGASQAVRAIAGINNALAGSGAGISFGGFSGLASTALNVLPSILGLGGGGTGDKSPVTPAEKRRLEQARKAQIMAMLENLSAITGQMAGTALGGGGQGANIGSQVGAMIGQAAIPIPIVGGIVGGIAGGLLGGLFDKPKRQPPQVIALEKIARDTGEQVKLLENMNKLMELQNVAFNIPSSFKLPAYGMSIAGGQVSNEINVEVNVGGSNVSAGELGNAVATAIAMRLESEYTSAGSYMSRTRY